ncbi:MAG: FKBP-type peptidyl-prolyl cis-trans isomerase [Coriobacteriia bacterium]|nr:FKBP-type peptidyl-prolyl cis-trans isomerase [Coriobacteriia bacterium]
MKLGSTVTLTYTGTLEDGTVFGVGTPEQPMVFQTGMDMVIAGLEKEILEMNEVGEKRSFKVGMYDAYGEYLEGCLSRVPREAMTIDAKVGRRVWLAGDGDERVPTTVVEVTNNEVVLDLNHPLAGKDLFFEVEILAIEEPPENFVPAEVRKKEQERLQRMLGAGGAEAPQTMML